LKTVKLHEKYDKENLSIIFESGVVFSKVLLIMSVKFGGFYEALSDTRHASLRWSAIMAV
jgi:hypothetical protein